MTEIRYINCAACGKRVERKAQAQKFCEECRNAIYPALAKEKPAAIRLCKDCGQVIPDPTPRQLYCAKCREEHEELYQERQRERKRQKQKFKSSESKRSLPTAHELAARDWSLRGKSADRVTIEARALGLSYGQYVAFVSNGSIDSRLRDMGIVDGVKRANKAWNEHLRKKGKSK